MNWTSKPCSSLKPCPWGIYKGKKDKRHLWGCFQNKGGFPNGSVVENLPAMQETRVLSLSGEDPLEKGMATHSSILAWRTPWTEESGSLQSIGSQRAGHDWGDWAHTPQDKRCLELHIYFLLSGSPTRTKLQKMRDYFRIFVTEYTTLLTISGT